MERGPISTELPIHGAAMAVSKGTLLGVGGWVVVLVALLWLLEDESSMVVVMIVLVLRRSVAIMVRPMGFLRRLAHVESGNWISRS